MRLYYMQGDCLIKKCGNHNVFEVEHGEIPSDAKPVAGNLALKGQTNSHALYDGKFQLFEHNGVNFLRVDETTTLDHVRDHLSGREKAEHHAQQIEPGDYFIDAVIEYDHILEESRQIID